MFIRVLSTTWRRKPAGIDIERNHVTVTPCIHRSSESLVGLTPTSNTTGEALRVVVQYELIKLVDTKNHFVYRQNPHVIDIFPLSHLLR